MGHPVGCGTSSRLDDTAPGSDPTTAAGLAHTQATPQGQPLHRSDAHFCLVNWWGWHSLASFGQLRRTPGISRGWSKLANWHPLASFDLSWPTSKVYIRIVNKCHS